MNRFSKIILSAVIINSVAAVAAYASDDPYLHIVPCPEQKNLESLKEGSAMATVNATVGGREEQAAFFGFNKDIHPDSVFTVHDATYVEKLSGFRELVCHYTTQTGAHVDFAMTSNLQSIYDEKVTHLGNNFQFEYKGGNLSK